DLGDGTKRLLDFESEEILMTAAASDYVEWGSKAAVNVAYSLTNNAVEFTHTSNALLLDNTANASSTVFGGVTFTFPEEVRFGTLYVDICRFSGDGCGVLIEDENGNCVPLFPLEWGSEYYTETSKQFYTLTITLSEVRKNAPRFSRIKKITFYVRSAKGGKFLFDNVRYDDVNMGFLGEVYYDEYQNALTWDEVTNAKKYELLIDGKTATTYTNEFLADDEFSIGKHTVTIKAMNGSMMREKTYAVDIGPSAPEVSYDKTTNTLSWREAFGATSYEIVVKNWNTDETVFTQTTSITSVVLDGAYEGVYSIFVYALSADGARSKPCSLAFRTVSDGEIGIGATLENGKYKLFDFESTTALLIARDSDYIDWQWNGSPTLIKIPYKIEDGVLWISQQSDGKMHYGGVTFEVENAIEISGFGFSHKRISGDGAGVVVEDEKGNKVRLLGYEWSEDADSDYQKTKGEWVEYSFTIEQIREICEEFGKLKSVTFYAHASRYGEYLFDNVYYF
ncbi:MAG: hypothetical protein IIX01_01325, partial [Clostridia bacterium]|nr:hypothetical protein [Clostridia bacterium]